VSKIKELGDELDYTGEQSDGKNAQIKVKKGGMYMDEICICKCYFSFVSASPVSRSVSFSCQRSL